MSKNKTAAKSTGDCSHGGGTRKSDGKHFAQCFPCMLQARHDRRVAAGKSTRRERAVARYGLVPVSAPIKLGTVAQVAASISAKKAPNLADLLSQVQALNVLVAQAIKAGA
jgi:hypothetical protein